MSEPLRDLRSMPLDALITEHDRLAQNTSVGTRHYLEEVARRDAIGLADAIASNTEQVAAEVRRLFELSEASGKRAERLTLVVTILTAANLIAAIVAAVAAVAAVSLH
jgi:hypothetical protein